MRNFTITGPEQSENKLLLYFQNILQVNHQRKVHSISFWIYDLRT